MLLTIGVISHAPPGATAATPAAPFARRRRGAQGGKDKAPRRIGVEDCTPEPCPIHRIGKFGGWSLGVGPEPILFFEGRMSAVQRKSPNSSTRQSRSIVRILTPRIGRTTGTPAGLSRSRGCLQFRHAARRLDRFALSEW